MYAGTLYGHWQAIVTLQQMVIIADADGTVDMTPPAIAAKTSIPLEIIEAGIKFLSKEDKYSRSENENGKRIILIDESRPWGWQIVNYEYYRGLASREDKKKKDRERIALKRSKNASVAKCRKESPNVANVAHTKTKTNTNTNVLKENNKRKVTIPKNFCLSDSMIEYAKKNGVTKRKTLEKFTEKFILQNKAKGYKYVDHESAWKSWLRKAIDDGSIQKDPVRSKGDY